MSAVSKEAKEATAVPPSYDAAGARVEHNEIESITAPLDEEDRLLVERVGVKSEFAREFKSFSTISYAFAIMGLVSSVATTFNSPFMLGGPASTVWTWFMGSVLNMSIGTAIAELVSAYPSAGGLYTASGLLVPRRYRRIVAWFTGWLNFLGQIAGIAGTEWGLANMIYAWVYVITDHPNRPDNNPFVASTGATIGLYIALICLHGIINSLGTKTLARMTSGYVVVNLGITAVIIIVLLAVTPLNEMHSASETFTRINNQSGYPGRGGDALAFLFGLYSVQFVMTDYDATAHISEEVHRASIAAPVAITIAVMGTGLVGWILNIVLVLCSGDVAESDFGSFPGGMAMAEIMYRRMGKVGFLVVWPFVCSVAFFVVTTAIQANARSFYAFSRDRGFPDRGFFAKINKRTGTTVNAVWLVVAPCIAMIFLAFTKQHVGVNAIFALAALGMDLSYLSAIIARQIFANHPEVNFRPGPFTLGKGWFGRIVNYIAILWTLFECVILSIPTEKPMDQYNFNYSWVIMIGVLILAAILYVLYGRFVYRGPQSTLSPELLRQLGIVNMNAEFSSGGASDGEHNTQPQSQEQQEQQHHPGGKTE
ncbi:polyamine transporter tpo5 [Malassezia cuniculi]|uniref:Polyamine transporter tpo5 n=1 Tax=Malassezia cuniculi TaxID=948313 RepID=A0AAF0EXI5_9BASI|nr:polyamine transporter tpo5 [Malassezia cuniculi]